MSSSCSHYFFFSLSNRSKDKAPNISLVLRIWDSVAGCIDVLRVVFDGAHFCSGVRRAKALRERSVTLPVVVESQQILWRRSLDVSSGSQEMGTCNQSVPRLCRSRFLCIVVVEVSAVY